MAERNTDSHVCTFCGALCISFEELLLHLQTHETFESIPLSQKNVPASLTQNEEQVLVEILQAKQRTNADQRRKH